MNQQPKIALSWLAQVWERILASDPGLTRLRMAGSAAIGVATALGVEYTFAILMHAGPKGVIVSMLFGAVVAMMGMMALSGNDTLRTKVRTALFFPVAIGTGLVSGTVAHVNTDLMLAVFVVVMFVAVAIRRFGIPFFFYGFMGWMGYFFASFMGAKFSQLPGLFVAILIATLWVLLLSSLVLRTNPARALHGTLSAFDTRTRSVVQSCVSLLTTEDDDKRGRLLRRLRARQIQLSEAALMVEGWSAEPGAVPSSYSAPYLRRKVIDAQQVLDRLAGSTEVLLDSTSSVKRAAAQTIDYLVLRDDATAIESAQQLLESIDDVLLGESEQLALRIFGEAAIEFAELSLETVFQRAQNSHVKGGTTQDTTQDSADKSPKDSVANSVEQRSVDEFEPVVGLFMGDLPGSPAVAREVPAVGVSWNPLARLDFITRQAIQVAVAGILAIVFGRMLSPVRYYWAVIAAFIMFTGTATRSESFIKGVNRIIGTLAGLLASIWLAELTAGHTLWVLVVVVASIFFGFYLIRVSYAYMIFFITIMIGQLYSILHEFSPGLLLLRLEETAIGATAGFIVAVLVVPLSTQSTIRAARDALLTDLKEFLQSAATILEKGRDSEINLDAQSLALDDRLRQLALVAKPLMRPLIWGYSPRVRHRLAQYAALTAGARAVAVALRDEDLPPSPELAENFRELAEITAQCANSEKGMGVSGDTEVNTVDAPRTNSAAALASKTKSIPSDRGSFLWGCARLFAGQPNQNTLVRRQLHIQGLLYELSTSNTDPL